MAADPFLDEDYRVLTTEAFDFVLNNELKRAARSQSFLTLVHVEPTIRGVAGGGNGDRDHAVREIARLVSRDVRETDLLAQTENGRLSIVLLDSDLENSIGVINRLMARLDHYAFPRPLAIQVGAACCPTHGVDVASLRRAAESQSVHRSRDDRGNISYAH
jgi:GGDEF domain-containing protein